MHQNLVPEPTKFLMGVAWSPKSKKFLLEHISVKA